jgi:hypothetical protein
VIAKEDTMRRFSIRTLMAFVLVFAVGLAALRNANAVWAGAMLLLAFASVGVAVVGMCLMRGRERAWWLGFGVFSGGYLAVAVAPVLSSPFNAYLGTTSLLNSVQLQVATASSTRLGDLVSRRAALAARIELIDRDDPTVSQVMNRGAAELAKLDAIIEEEQSSQLYAKRWQSLLPGAANEGHFRSVGHSLFALLAGLIGGTVAVWFDARREAGESHFGSVPGPTQETAPDADESGS